MKKSYILFCRAEISLEKIIRSAFLIISVSFAICFSSEVFASAGKTIKLTIYAFGSSGIVAGLSENKQGHTWLTIENKGTETVSFNSYSLPKGDIMSISIIPDNEGRPGGVHINWEFYAYTGKTCTSYSIMISKSQLQLIEKLTPKESYYTHSLDDELHHNCTTYSKKMWNLVSPKSLDTPFDRNPKQLLDKPLTAYADIPGDIAKIIRKWPGSKKGTFKNPKKKTLYDVYHLTKKGKLEPWAIHLSKKKITLKMYESSQLHTSLLSPNTKLEKKVTWKSTDPKIMTVKNGKVTAKSPGRCLLLASYDPLNLGTTCIVEVKKPKLKLSAKSITLKRGKSKKLKVLVDGKKRKVKWKSSNRKIAVVKNGRITGKKAGVCWITASIGGVKAKCKVTVKIPRKKKKSSKRPMRLGYNAVMHGK